MKLALGVAARCGVGLPQIARPAQTFVYYENSPIHSKSLVGFWQCTDLGNFLPMVFHGGYADGHAKLVRASFHRFVRLRVWEVEPYPCPNFDPHWFVRDDRRNDWHPLRGWDVD